jgi:hypothetical protein
MTIRGSDTLKSYFTLSKVPTPSNYGDLIDTIFAQSSIGPIGEHTHDDLYIQLSIANTILAVHTFNPSSYNPPFILGQNAQGQTVVGLKADQLNRTISVSGLGLSGGGVLTLDRIITLTSSSNPGASASILASTADGILSLLRINTDVIGDRSGSNLTLSPTGDIIFDPTGNDLYPLTNYDLNLGLLNKKFLALHAAELWVETLVAFNTLATIGGRVLIGATTELTLDLGVSDTTIYVKHNEMANGDIVYLEENGSVEFMQITSSPSGGGPYSYTVTRNLDGSGANNWYAGTAVFNTGTTGDGFIDLYSFRGVKSATQYGPTIVGNVRDSATYNAWTEHWAIGNLNGLYGYSVNTYGVGLGKYGNDHLVIDSINGVRFRDASNNVVAQFNAAVLTMGNTAQDHAVISTAGFQLKDSTVVKFDAQTDGDLFIGTNLSNAEGTYFSIFSQAQTYNTESFSAGDMLIGDNSTNKANIFWDKSTGQLNFRGGQITQAYISTTGAITAGVGNVKVDINGFSVMNCGPTITMYSSGTDIAAQLYYSPVSNNQNADWGASLILEAGDYSGGELVVNGSFENNSDWTFGGINVPERSTERPRLGAYSVSGAIYADLLIDGSASIATSDYITGIVAGDRIKISFWFWYYSVNDSQEQMDPDYVTRQVKLDWYNSSSVLISTYTYTIGVPPQEVWQRISFTSTAAPTNTNKIKVTIYQEALGGSWYLDGLTNLFSVDDVSIRKTGQSGSIDIRRKGILFDIDSSYSVLNSELQSYLFMGTGVKVGNVSQTPAVGELYATGSIRLAGGILVGDTASAPATGNVVGIGDGLFGGGLSVGSVSVNPGTGSIITTGSVYINDDTNTKSTLGLTINQGSYDNEILAFKSSDINHGVTDYAETDTYGTFTKRDADMGGLAIRGYTEDIVGLQLLGITTNSTTVKGTSGLGAVTISATKKSGTSWGDLAANENILSVRNGATTLFLFDADGDFNFSGNLQSYKNSTVYTGYIFVPLDTPLTSTSWDGDAYSTTAKTLIDLSGVFGAPANIKAVLFTLGIRDSGSASGSDYYIILSPNATAGSGAYVDCGGLTNDAWERDQLIIPCDANGDVYYQIAASGSLTMDVHIHIYGYWI